MSNIVGTDLPVSYTRSHGLSLPRVDALLAEEPDREDRFVSAMHVHLPAVRVAARIFVSDVHLSRSRSFTA